MLQRECISEIKEKKQGANTFKDFDITNTTMSQTKYGEKTNIEYGWGNSIRENIHLFFFQLIRDKELIDLENQLYKMLSEIKENPKQYRDELIILYKILGHTRDIRNGRGECLLSYMQLYIWYLYDPELAFFALEQFVQGEKYGSWKDIKKLCLYIKKKTNNQDHPLIDYACNLMIVQLKHDLKRMQTNVYISLAGKWAPREKSRQYRWIYIKLALGMHPEFIESAKNPEANRNALRKAKMVLRKNLSKINRYLMTLETIMCNGNWGTIFPAMIPSNALYKYKQALQNKTSENKVRKNTMDRHICAGYIQYHIENNPPKYSTVALKTLVKGAQSCKTNLDKDIINSLWNANKKKCNFLENIVAIVDVSSSMERDNRTPLYKAIALGIRASELSKGAFKNRLFVFSANPVWLKFNNDMTFVDKVNMILSVSRGLNSNLKAVLDILIEALTKNDCKDAIKNMRLCIFSDMQIDTFFKYSNDTLYNNIKKIFVKNGFKTSPKLIFWNMRKTSGFPVPIYTSDTILLSGGVDKMFKLLELSSSSPTIGSRINEHKSWKIIQKYLNSRRYRILYNKIISKI
jgi:hypothetical protein